MYLQPCNFSMALATTLLPVSHVQVWQVNIDLRPPLFYAGLGWLDYFLSDADMKMSYRNARNLLVQT